ncbi:MAG TPA: Mov34/MPN/PAD-1 family protein [Coleofasciculaceae cyanobacterium]|jgi:proteasome lid subunit RPN8/RPN11
MLPPNLQEQLATHSHLDPNRESCGFVINDIYYPAINVADDPNDFRLDPQSTRKVIKARDSGQQVIICHSHINSNPTFSPADIVASKGRRLPYALYHLSTATHSYYDPNAPIAPYEGREWHWVIDNCYTLCQDYYLQEFNIKLGDFYLSTPDEYKQPDFTAYLDNMESQGFLRLHSDEPLKVGDFILMNYGSMSPNHAAIMFDLEGNLILHHIVNHLSHIGIYGSQYRKITHSVWRHHQFK